MNAAENANRAKYVVPCLQAVLVFAFSLFAPVLSAAALPFIKWDANATPDSKRTSGSETVRGDLPAWLSWLTTPDERLPGGTYEATVKRLLDRLGKYATAYYWIGVRNRAHGLAYLFRKPMTNHFNAMTDYKDLNGLLERDGVWRFYWGLPFGFCFVAGYRSYHSDALGYYGTPVFTIKRA